MVEAAGRITVPVSVTMKRWCAALQAELAGREQVSDVGAFRSIDSRFHLTLAE